MVDGAKAVDAYLATVPEPAHSALQKLRAQILAAAGAKAEELINYGIPMIRVEGRNLVSFAVAKAHCSFLIQSSTLMETLADDVANYSTSKGTIRFTPDKPIPAALVKKIVKARIAENTSIAKAKGK